MMSSLHHSEFEAMKVRRYWMDRKKATQFYTQLIHFIQVSIITSMSYDTFTSHDPHHMTGCAVFNHCWELHQWYWDAKHSFILLHLSLNHRHYLLPHLPLSREELRLDLLSVAEDGSSQAHQAQQARSRASYRRERTCIWRSKYNDEWATPRWSLWQQRV